MILKYLPILLLLFSFLGVDAAVFTLQNKCRETIWPGIQASAGKPQLMDGGVQLRTNDIITSMHPTGCFWGRSGCSFDQSGKGTCITGDCSGVLKCDRAGGAPPATLAEFTVDSPVDYFDISLVDGYNMPLSIFPFG
ncbi:Thaumatin [Quillaja saponaria]|uniref:Thaumatin n=1 Tax=Quillaja saponaria TaxID=32244 RepID=A0AAD7L0E4_QUISA|nr:Thaumatin [Quillaja saponaria]